jgi:tryptophanyl-tRNA synthetase
MTIQRILTGIQATGELHLGNYAGAILPILEFAKANPDEQEVFVFCADWHGLTNKDKFEKPGLYRNKVLACLLALGYPVDKHVLYTQSSIPEILEMVWYLSSSIHVGILERNVTYKDALQNNKLPTVALFNYPILMACDILAVKANMVPVGKDQSQHLELCADFAKSFNHMTQTECFPIPKAYLQDNPVLPGNDGRKMSKSYGNTLELFADLKTVQKQIKAIKTDSKSREEPKDPSDCLVYQYMQALGNQESTAYMADKLRQGNYGYGDAKADLWQAYNAVFTPEKYALYAELQQDSVLTDMLAEPLEKVRSIVVETTQHMRQALKF